MLAGCPSRTAQHNALFRALEQRLPHPLFADPWARRFLRGRYRLAALLPAGPLARAIDWRWPGPRAAVAVRTRYIDDAVVRALSQGLDQLVILGAGLDARPYRLPGLQQVRVFEVDHPSTQSMKRAVVGRPPAHVTYVPLDFTGGRLEDALEGAGFRTGLRTLFLWEGVTNYLDEVSVDATLRFVGRAGTSVVFTYVDRGILTAPTTFMGAAESMALVKSLGEPFTFGFVPDAVAGYLHARGIELIEDLPLSVAAGRYYPRDAPAVSAYYHVVCARCRG